jgi:uncharacterized Tic20 family protein
MTGFPAQEDGDWDGSEADGSGEGPGTPLPARDGDEAWAMLAYMGIPFFNFVAPLAIRVGRSAGSPYLRLHATQALNMAITLALYNICALILFGVLAVDAVSAALEIALPLAVALWLVALLYLVRAAVRASLGEFYQFPRWICATVVSP